MTIWLVEAEREQQRSAQPQQPGLPKRPQVDRVGDWGWLDDEHTECCTFLSRRTIEPGVYSHWHGRRGKARANAIRPTYRATAGRKVSYPLAPQLSHAAACKRIPPPVTGVSLRETGLPVTHRAPSLCIPWVERES